VTATIDLGGPASPCSIARLRRLHAGELLGEERAKTAAHLLACERCRASERELAAERAALLRDVPFEAFASGVAERLASEKPARARLYRYAPLLAAASILIVALPVALRDRRNPEEQGERSKGGALAQLYVKDARGVHPWSAGEEIPETADVHAELLPGSRSFAAVVLLEGGEVHPLFSGPARGQDGKPRVVSFGWTGAHDALLVVQLGDQQLDVGALAQQVRARGGPPATGPAEVSAVRLQRGR
jgi:hypothetical protein